MNKLMMNKSVSYKDFRDDRQSNKNIYDKNWYRIFSDMTEVFQNFQRSCNDYEATHQKFPTGLNRYK